MDVNIYNSRVDSLLKDIYDFLREVGVDENLCHRDTLYETLHSIDCIDLDEEDLGGIVQIYYRDILDKFEDALTLETKIKIDTNGDVSGSYQTTCTVDGKYLPDGSLNIYWIKNEYVELYTNGVLIDKVIDYTYEEKITDSNGKDLYIPGKTIVTDSNIPCMVLVETRILSGGTMSSAKSFIASKNVPTQKGVKLKTIPVIHIYLPIDSPEDGDDIES